MSRKSRERREKNKTVRPDDYFSNGTFEMARFGKNTIVRNNRTPEQHAAQMEYLRAEYASKYEDIAQKVKSLKEKVTQCDPYSLLMYLRSLATMGQMNIFSEIEYSSDANAIIRAQEYVQSILVSTDNNYVPSSPSEEAVLHAQIVADFDELYKDFRFFYHFWAAHIQKSGKIGDSRLNEIVESQYMYWVRGNRYQIFELEPLKSLLPPHNDVLFLCKRKIMVNCSKMFSLSIQIDIIPIMPMMKSQDLTILQKVESNVCLRARKSPKASILAA